MLLRTHKQLISYQARGKEQSRAPIDMWRVMTKQVTIGKNILTNIVWDHVMLFR